MWWMAVPWRGGFEWNSQINMRLDKKLFRISYNRCTNNNNNDDADQYANAEYGQQQQSIRSLLTLGTSESTVVPSNVTSRDEAV